MRFAVSLFFGECVVWLVAWSTGFVLENVRLKVEAFDYLQLPFVFTEGCIGRLEVQARTPCTSTICYLEAKVSTYCFRQAVSS